MCTQPLSSYSGQETEKKKYCAVLDLKNSSRKYVRGAVDSTLDVETQLVQTQLVRLTSLTAIPTLKKLSEQKPWQSNIKQST